MGPSDASRRGVATPALTAKEWAENQKLIIKAGYKSERLQAQPQSSVTTNLIGIATVLIGSRQVSGILFDIPCGLYHHNELSCKPMKKLQ